MCAWFQSCFVSLSIACRGWPWCSHISHCVHMLALFICSLFFRIHLSFTFCMVIFSWQVRKMHLYGVITYVNLSISAPLSTQQPKALLMSRLVMPSPGRLCQILTTGFGSYESLSPPSWSCVMLASLPVWSHYATARWNRCKEDLNSFLPGELEETTRTPSHHVNEDYPTGSGII